ncbi:unnamed protein product [Spirodela intermedia]|uniref:Uncharacterized protein n=1 Tax=Spirodela intermedia TaxID=51605 RepID=A0A7I8IHR1_SPIIN|nr:unnamed protein product [Spirodela intermedia]CAA6657415.1 unnamed protein product [Spirodela intermedia]
MRTPKRLLPSVSRSLSAPVPAEKRSPSTVATGNATVASGRRRLSEASPRSDSVGKLVIAGRVKDAVRSLVLLHRRGEPSGADALGGHAHVTVIGFSNDTFFFNHLINMYGKCGSLDDAHSVFRIIKKKNLHSWNTLMACYCRGGHLSTARQLFDQMPNRDSVSWNLMISGYDRHGPCEEALRIFANMRHSGAITDHFGVSSVVSACCNLRFSVNGRLLHGALVELYAKCMYLCEARREFDLMDVREPFTWNSMLAGYVYCSRIDQALQFFDEMPKRDVVSWTMIIEGCSQHKRNGQAIDFFQEMRECGLHADQVAFVSVLNALHGLTVKCGYEANVTVGSVLVSLYAKCGNFDDARRVTEVMHFVDDFSWSVLIAEYAKQGHVERSRMLFESVQEKSLALWNALITGYSELGMYEEAAGAFKELCVCGPKGDSFTYGSLLTASSTLGLGYGEQLHSQVTRAGVSSSFFVCGALIDMYFFFYDRQAAEKIFHAIDEPNIVLWNVMIFGYGQNTLNYEALNTFRVMRYFGPKPDNVTLSCALDSCSNISALAWGAQIHAHSHKTGLDFDVVVGSAIVDMYGKCGHIEFATLSFLDIRHPSIVSWTALLGGYVKCGIWDKAKAFFAVMPEKNVVSWNVMLSGYVQQGCAWDALNLYTQMNKLGVWPDHISFISLLTACCKLLLKEQGRQIHAQIIKTGYYMNRYVDITLTSMYEIFGMGAIKPKIKVLGHPTAGLVNLGSLQVLTIDVNQWRTLPDECLNSRVPREICYVYLKAQVVYKSPQSCQMVVFGPSVNIRQVNSGITKGIRKISNQKGV